ncbi:hypothetical protein KFE98_18965 [bacterium SCSIO 12741]|nr:hypothetical protein KFE98_18965 [bacterium SCSIO 12741]
MKKKRKTPLVQRIIQRIFPVLEAVSPSLAGKWATKLFFTPFRFKPPQPEEQRAADARWTRLQVNEDEIQIYQWGPKMLLLPY